MKCPNCSFDNLPDAPFCENCGEVFLPGDLEAAEVPHPEVEIIDVEPSAPASSRGSILSDVPPVVKIPEVFPSLESVPEVERSKVGDTAPKAKSATTVAAVASVSVEEGASDFDDEADITGPIDLSGFERMVDSSYRPPVNDQVHAGDTAEIPVIEDDGYVAQPRSYTVGLTEREQRQREREQRRMAKKFAKYQQKEEERAGRDSALTVPLDDDATTGAMPVIMLDDDSELPGYEEPLYTEATVTTVHEPAATGASKGSKAKAGQTAPVPPAKTKKMKADAPKGSAAAYARNHSNVPWKIIALVAAALLLLAAAGGAAWYTYNAEMWGGKTIPEVVGLSQDAATAALTERGFTVEVTEEKSDTAPGTVLSCAPEQGTRAAEGSAITLTVATARTVPSVVGLSRDEALSALAAEGLDAVEVTEQKSNEADGTVLSVSPEAGTPALSSDAIALVVAVPYTVPPVEGLTADEARAALEAEGYVVTSKWSYTEDVKEGFALSTDPAAGTQLNAGAEVTLYVAKSRGNELVAQAKKILPGARLKNDTGRFIIDSVESVTYAGNDVVSYTCEAHQYEDIELPFDKGTQRVEDDKRVTLEGTLTFNSDNEVTSADPSISY